MTIDLLSSLCELKLNESPGSDSSRTSFRRSDFERKVSELGEEILHNYPLEGGGCARRELSFSLKDFTKINESRAALEELQNQYLSRERDTPILSYYNLDVLKSKIDNLKKEVLLQLPKEEGESFPDRISAEDLAGHIEREIEEIQIDADNDREDYIRFAKGLLNVIHNLAQNPQDTLPVRLSKTHDCFRIQDTFPYAHIIRSCWMWMSEDANSVEVQMIHSAKEERFDFSTRKWSIIDHAILGRGSYKKVKRSTHFSILLRPVPGEKKVNFTKTALVRGITSDVDVQGCQIPRRRINPSLYWKGEMREVINEIDILEKNIRKVGSLLSAVGPSAKLAWGALRHNDFCVSKIMGKGTRLESRMVQKKLEREEQYYDGDLSNLRDKMSLEAKIKAMLDVGDALAGLHRRGIVHCDVKTPNVLGKFRDRHNVEAFLADFDLTVKEGRMREDFGTYEYWNQTANNGIASKSTDIYGFAILMGELFFSTRFYYFRANPDSVKKEIYGELLKREEQEISARVMGALDYHKAIKLGPFPPKPSSNPEKSMKRLISSHGISEEDKNVLQQGLKDIRLMNEIHEFIYNIVLCDFSLLEKLSQNEALEPSKCQCSPSYRKNRVHPQYNLTLMERLLSEDQIVARGAIDQANDLFPNIQECLEAVRGMTTRYLS